IQRGKNEDILFDGVANVHDNCSCQLPEPNRPQLRSLTESISVDNEANSTTKEVIHDTTSQSSLQICLKQALNRRAFHKRLRATTTRSRCVHYSRCCSGRIMEIQKVP
ncbi:LOW QUALITY PROTEIN: hypothetical protein HID58_085340, partial [Brassica napus]